MEQEDFTPEFPLEWALKGRDLAIEASGDHQLSSWQHCPARGKLSRTPDMPAMT